MDEFYTEECQEEKFVINLEMYEEELDTVDGHHYLPCVDVRA